MSFISFKQKGKDLIINTDRIISIDFNSEFNKIVITCTDNVNLQVDESEAFIRKALGVKKNGEKKIGF